MIRCPHYVIITQSHNSYMSPAICGARLMGECESLSVVCLSRQTRRKTPLSMSALVSATACFLARKKGGTTNLPGLAHSLAASLQQGCCQLARCCPCITLFPAPLRFPCVWTSCVVGATGVIDGDGDCAWCCSRRGWPPRCAPRSLPYRTPRRRTAASARRRAPRAPRRVP